MRVAILGYSVEGKSAASYWGDLGHDITIHDANGDLAVPTGLQSVLGSQYLQNLDQYDLIVRSPGIRPSLIFEANPGLDKAKITSVTSEFLAQCPAKVIGVTGTKGKGTVSSLIAAILKEAGHTVHLGGNIGTPPLDFLSDIQPDDWVVLELSSYQLMDVQRSPHVGVMLMIASDHQDWHPTMDEYLEAKQNIFKFQHQGDRAVYNACNLYSLQSGLAAPSDQVAYNSPDGAWVDGSAVKMGSQRICENSVIALSGRHNQENVCAAIAAVWPMVPDPEAISRGVASFAGLPHRLEQVRKVDGVTYYDDSISTNPETAIGALNSFSEPKVLILGGSSKKHSFKRLADQVSHSNVRAAILIGETSPDLKQALEGAGYEHVRLGSGSMDEIVALAAKESEPGDVVLLSPGCASFGLFKDYKDRGDRFQAAVKTL